MILPKKVPHTHPLPSISRPIALTHTSIISRLSAILICQQISLLPALPPAHSPHSNQCGLFKCRPDHAIPLLRCYQWLSLCLNTDSFLCPSKPSVVRPLPAPPAPSHGPPPTRWSPVVFSNWSSLFMCQSFTTPVPGPLPQLLAWLGIDSPAGQRSTITSLKPPSEVAPLLVSLHTLPHLFPLGTCHGMKPSSFMCLLVYGLSLPLGCKLMKTGSLSVLFATCIVRISHIVGAQKMSVD